MKLDTHVHTFHSGNSTIYPLQNILRESYNTPESVYRVAKSRGMDLVVITDHDEISGALALAHLPDVIVGCEVTGVFPDDGVRVHLNVFGLDEAQHRRGPAAATGPPRVDAVSAPATALHLAQPRGVGYQRSHHGAARRRPAAMGARARGQQRITPSGAEPYGAVPRRGQREDRHCGQRLAHASAASGTPGPRCPGRGRATSSCRVCSPGRSESAGEWGASSRWAPTSFALRGISRSISSVECTAGRSTGGRTRSCSAASSVSRSSRWRSSARTCTSSTRSDSTKTCCSIWWRVRRRCGADSGAGGLMTVRVAVFTDNDFDKVNGVTTALTALVSHAPADVLPRIYTASAPAHGRADLLCAPVDARSDSVLQRDEHVCPARAGVPASRRCRRDRRSASDDAGTDGPDGALDRREDRSSARRQLSHRLAGLYRTAEWVAAPRATGWAPTCGGCTADVRPCSCRQRQPAPCCFGPGRTAEHIVCGRVASTRRCSRPCDGRRCLRERWQVSEASPALLYVGRLSREKGLEMLPRILERLHALGMPHRLIVAGDGPLRSWLMRAMPGCDLHRFARTRRGRGSLCLRGRVPLSEPHRHRRQRRPRGAGGGSSGHRERRRRSARKHAARTDRHRV